MLPQAYNLLISLCTGRLLKFERKTKQLAIDLGPLTIHSSTRTIAGLASAMPRGIVQVGPIFMCEMGVFLWR